MPLTRRVPKVQTQPSRTRPPRQSWAEVNVSRLAEKFASGATVSPDAMAEAGLVRRRRPVKVLGGGELDRPLTVKAHGFTRSARQKIEQAGGKVEVVGAGPQEAAAAPVEAPKGSGGQEPAAGSSEAGKDSGSPDAGAE
jgi:large subunit ribosomal protein L15